MVLGMWHEEERIVELEEYVQGNGLVKHYDTIDWVIGSIFIPISLTILGLSFTEPIINLKSVLPVAILCSLSISILLIWLLLDNRFSFFCKQIYERLREIERKYGMNTHEKIHHEDNARCYKILRRAQNWIRIFAIMIFIAWVLRIAYFYING